MKLKVVEFRALPQEVEDATLARFVLLPDDSIKVVGLFSTSKSGPKDIVEKGIYDRSEQVVTLADGIRFLEALSFMFHGSRFWATEVFEMEEAEALRGYDENGNPIGSA